MLTHEIHKTKNHVSESQRRTKVSNVSQTREERLSHDGKTLMLNFF